MRFEVALSGDSTALDFLSRTFSNDDCRIVKGDCTYLLSGTCLDALDDASLVRDRAFELAKLLSGACQVLLGFGSPIQVGAVTEILPGGGPRISGLVAEATGCTVPPSVRTGDKVTHPTDKARDWLLLAQKDSEVAHGLLLWSDGTGWWNLWKIFELVEKSSGGVKGIVRRGWATKDQCDRFARMAQSRTALGVDSRHAFDKSTPPSRPMERSEAFNLVGSLFRQWAASRSEQHEGTAG
jgi:hypothetical protein